MVFRQLDNHKENKTGSILHCTLNQFQMYPRFKCKEGNHTSRMHEEFLYNLSVKEVFLAIIQNLKAIKEISINLIIKNF